MACHIVTTTVDSRNAFTQSLFWSSVLGFAENPNDPNKPEHEECLIQSPDGSQRILFIDVPDGTRCQVVTCSRDIRSPLLPHQC